MAATPTPPPASGINIWQVLTTLTSALLVAAVIGLFSMWSNVSRHDRDIEDLKTKVARMPELENKLMQYQLSTNEKLGKVDGIKEGIDRLTRLQDQRTSK